MSQKSRKVGWLSKLAVFAGASLLVVSGSQAAAAVDPSGLASTIEPDRQGVLNVHKFEQPEQLGEHGNGTEQDTSGLTPIEGIGFTVKLIDRSKVDLTTNQGWLDVAALEGDVEKATALGFDGTQPAPSELLTDAQGLAKFENLPVGLYLVTETNSKGYTPAVPFLVTVPITDPVNKTDWLYDVHVYPKNSKGNNKSVEDSTAVAMRDSVVWSILGDIPRGGALSGYQIADSLDSRLEYVPTAKVSLTNADSVALEAGDYQIDFVDSEQHPKFVAGKYPVNTVLVTFTATGLKKLEAAGGASGISQVKVEIETVVTSLGGDGEISNTAVIYPDKPSVDWKPGNPEDPENPGTVTPPAVTKWGNIVFKKTDGEGNALAGAEFQVFLSEADALAKKNPIAVVRDSDGTKIDPPRSTFVSGSDGQVKIPGLRWSTWANNAEVQEGDKGYQAYWLVETKSPEGFTLLAEPIKVEVNSTENPVVVSGATGNGDNKLETVVNVPDNGGFELPKTGGFGTWMLGLGSLLLAAGAVAMIVRRSQNRTHQG
ncbi:MAG: SpaH/EbpB family LPXTG-anchored major pilin [Leucobacter sp.]